MTDSLSISGPNALRTNCSSCTKMNNRAIVLYLFSFFLSNVAAVMCRLSVREELRAHEQLGTINWDFAKERRQSRDSKLENLCICKPASYLKGQAKQPSCVISMLCNKRHKKSYRPKKDCESSSTRCHASKPGADCTQQCNST